MLKKFKSLRASGASRMTARGALFGRFAKKREGVVAVEFALLAPLMLTLLLGALELTQSIWADGKVEEATNTMGDLISRQTADLTDTDFVTLGYSGPLVLQPYPENDLNITVSSIIACHKIKGDATSKLEYYTLWSRKWQAGTAKSSVHTIDTKFSRQPGSLDILEGDTLIVTEGAYNYSPTISRKLGQTWKMGGYAFHQPRNKNLRIGYSSQENSNPTDCDCLRTSSC